MESERPMDRLICGDVGYGKTEVALRAAFKAADAGKQVLMLVPTTILAQQHFGTFTERLRDYPFTIEHVSRFRPPAEQRDGGQALRRGQGRHPDRHAPPALRATCARRTSGCSIVDEEQRFGVKQKELLRQMKLKVDVISMSATPIPRTLQMSLAGLRDISVIETPPEGRRPVKTYVGEYDEQLVKQALEREKARGGQAFFLHNRVEDIDETAERLRALCPGMRFSVAHGQIDEKRARGADARASCAARPTCSSATSIIESGIDIPQANTLIVERADTFGLSPALPDPRPRRPLPRARLRLPAVSQRGRADAGGRRPPRGAVGLHRARAPASRSRCATSSCAAPATCSATSSPATSPRSASSSTCRCSTRRCGRRRPDEAARTLPEPVRLDVNVDAYVPADYIPYEQAKVDVHRRIAGAREVAELAELRRELADRFGELPEPLENLIALQQARIKLGEAGAHGGHVPAGPARRHADRARLRAGQQAARGDPRRAVRVGQVAALDAGPRRPRAALPRRRARRGRAARGAARGAAA